MGTGQGLGRSARSGPRLLTVHRQTMHLLEHARVAVEGGRVVARVADDAATRVYNIPHANLAVLFLGQGTSLTQEAAAHLAEEGVFVAFTGTGGAPLHFGALTAYRATRQFRRMVRVYSSPDASLAAAKAIMEARIALVDDVGSDLVDEFLGTVPRGLQESGATFRRSLDATSSVSELLGHEGGYAKALYAVMGKAFAIPDFRRIQGARETAIGDEPGDNPGVPASIRVANSLIDHGNYLAYGIAGASLWSLGIPPSMSVFHGRSRAGGLVFDLADSFKDAVVLPLAFHHARAARADAEARFRTDLMRTMTRRKLLERCYRTIDAALAAGEATSGLGSLPPEEDNAHA